MACSMSSPVREPQVVLPNPRETHPPIHNNLQNLFLPTFFPSPQHLAPSSHPPLPRQTHLIQPQTPPFPTEPSPHTRTRTLSIRRLNPPITLSPSLARTVHAPHAT